MSESLRKTRFSLYSTVQYDTVSSANLKNLHQMYHRSDSDVVHQMSDSDVHIIMEILESRIIVYSLFVCVQNLDTNTK